MDAIGAERWLRPYLREARAQDSPQTGEAANQKYSIFRRHSFAIGETRSIFRKIWLWVIVGVGVGASLHGFAPDDWFATRFGTSDWRAVPLAALAGIPLYSNVTAIVPVMESLLMKGLSIGTTLAFCMSAVAASLPEILLPRQIMTWKLQTVFMLYLWIVFTLAGWLFNYVGETFL